MKVIRQRMYSDYESEFLQKEFGYSFGTRMKLGMRKLGRKMRMGGGTISSAEKLKGVQQAHNAQRAKVIEQNAASDKTVVDKINAAKNGKVKKDDLNKYEDYWRMQGEQGGANKINTMQGEQNANKMSTSKKVAYGVGAGGALLAAGGAGAMIASRNNNQ